MKITNHFMRYTTWECFGITISYVMVCKTIHSIKTIWTCCTLHKRVWAREEWYKTYADGFGCLLRFSRAVSWISCADSADMPHRFCFLCTTIACLVAGRITDLYLSNSFCNRCIRVSFSSSSNSNSSISSSRCRNSSIFSCKAYCRSLKLAMFLIWNAVSDIPLGI